MHWQGVAIWARCACHTRPIPGRMGAHDRDRPHGGVRAADGAAGAATGHVGAGRGSPAAGDRWFAVARVPHDLGNRRLTVPPPASVDRGMRSLSRRAAGMLGACGPHPSRPCPGRSGGAVRPMAVRRWCAPGTARLAGVAGGRREAGATQPPDPGGHRPADPDAPARRGGTETAAGRQRRAEASRRCVDDQPEAAVIGDRAHGIGSHAPQAARSTVARQGRGHDRCAELLRDPPGQHGRPGHGAAGRDSARRPRLAGMQLSGRCSMPASTIPVLLPRHAAPPLPPDNACSDPVRGRRDPRAHGLRGGGGSAHMPTGPALPRRAEARSGTRPAPSPRIIRPRCDPPAPRPCASASQQPPRGAGMPGRHPHTGAGPSPADSSRRAWRYGKRRRLALHNPAVSSSMTAAAIGR